MKMKWIIAVALSLCLLCGLLPLTVSAEAENLASNGDLELGNTSGWDVKKGSLISAWELSDGVYKGNYALVLSATNQWQEAALKTIAVRKNATITVSFYYSHIAGGGAYHVFTYQGADTSGAAYQGGASAAMPDSASWRRVSYTFNSGNFDHITLKFCPSEDTDYVACVIDNLVVTMEGGDIPTNEKPTLTSFGTKSNRPKDAASNLIKNGGFEFAADAQWKTDTFIKGNLRVVEDATAPEGNHSLYLSGNSDGFHTFSVPVEPGMQYVFSAWVKSPRLSGQNNATATFGVMDSPNTFMVYEPYNGNGYGAASLSTETMQLMATSPDGEWHLRSVTFKSGSYTTVYIGVYGSASQLYLDDIALYQQSNGVEYISNLRTDDVWGYENEGDRYCANEDSLIEGIYMTTNDAQLYWSDNPAWRNGFLSFVDSGDEHGTVLQYSQSAHPEWKLHYIKWIEVTPYTDYTFTMDVKGLMNGGGCIGLMDDNYESPVMIDCYNLYWVSGQWETYSITFNSGAYSRIGFAIVDGGGCALIDEVRLFETDKGIADEPSETPPEPDPSLKPQPNGTSVMEMSGAGQAVLNSGFENSVHSWDIYQGTNVTADAAHSGNGGAHLKGNGSWDAMIEQCNIPVVEGQTYTLSFWYKVNSNGANIALYGTDTGKQYTYIWANANQWTHFTATFTVEGDTSLRFNACGGGNGVAEDIYLDDVCVSGDAVLGVAFRFEQEGFRIYANGKGEVNLSSATVIPYGDGEAYTLLRMGALVTNKAAFGEDERAMTLDNVNSITVADVPVVYVWNVSASGCSYAVRVVNVPQSAADTQIYARPYYVFEKDGEEIVVYGDIVHRSYNG